MYKVKLSLFNEIWISYKKCIVKENMRQILKFWRMSWYFKNISLACVFWKKNNWQVYTSEWQIYVKYISEMFLIIIKQGLDGEKKELPMLLLFLSSKTYFLLLLRLDNTLLNFSRNSLLIYYYFDQFSCNKLN